MRKLLSCSGLFAFALFCFIISLTGIAQEQLVDLELKLKNGSDKEKLALFPQVIIYYEHLSPAKTYTTINEFLQLSRNLHDKKSEANALRSLGFYHYLKNNLKLAEVYYDSSFNIAIGIKDSNEISSVMNFIGLLHWKQGAFNKAFSYYRNAMRIAKSVTNNKEVARSLNYMGLIYWKWGEYTSALEYFLKSLKLKDNLHDEFEIAITHNNVAYIYNELESFDQSLIHSHAAFIIAKKLNDKYSLGRAYNNMGVTYFKLGNFEKALDFQKKSLKVKKDADDKSGMGYSYYDIGNIYLAMKKYPESLENLFYSLNIREELKDNYGISLSMINIGKVLFAQGNISNAKNYFEKSLEIAKQNQLKEAIQISYYNLSALYEKLGDINNAYLNYKYFTQYKDSIESTEKRDKFIALRITYETETKEKEIELLKKNQEIQDLELRNQKIQIYILVLIVITFISLILYIYYRYRTVKKFKLDVEDKNREIALRNKQLEEVNIIKDKFFSIIAHDLKSPFLGLLGLTQILSEEYDSLEESEKKHFISRLQQSVKNIYELIENLLNWARIRTRKGSITPTVLELSNEISFSIELHKPAAAYKKISIVNKIDKDIKVTSDKTMLQTVMNNLITNAIKFSNEYGKIEIFSHQKEKEVEISIVDYGIGIEVEDAERLFKLDEKFSTLGTAKEVGTGLGLILCKEIIEKLGGKIWFESRVSVGTTFYFTLPSA